MARKLESKAKLEQDAKNRKNDKKEISKKIEKRRSKKLPKEI